MSARHIFEQNNGEVTKAFYEHLNSLGLEGQLAVALFRAQKRSSAAKRYRQRKHTRAAYEVKNWSLGEVCRLAALLYGDNQGSLRWGWLYDAKAINFENVLYVEIPQGQMSFHSPERMTGPDYPGVWDGIRGACEDRICRHCDEIAMRHGSTEEAAVMRKTLLQEALPVAVSTAASQQPAPAQTELRFS